MADVLFAEEKAAGKDVRQQEGNGEQHQHDNQGVEQLAFGEKINKAADKDTERTGPEKQEKQGRHNVILRDEFVPDVVDGAPPDAELGEADHHHRDDDDGGIKPVSRSPQHPGEDHPGQQVAGRYRDVAAEDAEDVLKIAATGQNTWNEKTVNFVNKFRRIFRGNKGTR